MRVTYVVPRYGEEILGGAEFGARMLAERLVSQLDWEVDVLTTCALDTVTWKNELPEGSTMLNGVKVHRFASRAGRDPDFDAFSTELLERPWHASIEEQELWVRWQGPVCDSLVEAIADCGAEIVAFYPYLYYPCIYGIGRVTSSAVLHPAAHSEPAIQLPIFQRVFESSSGFVFHTQGEQRLVDDLFGLAQRPAMVLGLGVEPGSGDAEQFRATFDLGDRPYLLALGRVDDGKGARMLAEWFAAYKERNPGPLALCFVGPVVHPPEAHSDIFVTGSVDDSTKWGALRGALTLVSASPFESFSLVLLEAWSVGVPVLVHGACEVTKEHAIRSGGGLWFDGFAEFEGAILRLAGDDDLRTELALAGKQYVEKNYAWQRLIERYASFLEGIAANKRAGLPGKRDVPGKKIPARRITPSIASTIGGARSQVSPQRAARARVNPLRIATVVPRYGAEIHGGAETAARLLAEHLAAEPGWQIDVFTTTARDINWTDSLPVGTSVEAGVNVHRFKAESGRTREFADAHAKIVGKEVMASNEDQERFFESQGPVCAALIDAVMGSDADIVTFHPYLYWPTVKALPRLAQDGRVTVLHPAAHDEAVIRLPVFKEVFGAASGLAFWSQGERRLVDRLFGAAPRPEIVLGLGVDSHTGEHEPARQKVGLGARPYVLCLGRVDDGKGVRVLAEYFAAYKERHPGPLGLVFVGPIVKAPAPHPDIVVTGSVDEATKWGLLRGAQVLISPSQFESFAIVLLEAWSVEVPVLVNAGCVATRDHVVRSGGGLWFDHYARFEVALDQLLADGASRAATDCAATDRATTDRAATDSAATDRAESLRSELGIRGRRYVETKYHWPTLVRRYQEFLSSLTN